MRFVIENVLLFLLPAAVYLTYKLLRENPERKSTMQVMNEAPLVIRWPVDDGGSWLELCANLTDQPAAEPANVAADPGVHRANVFYDSHRTSDRSRDGARDAAPDGPPVGPAGIATDDATRPPWSVRWRLATR